jgi:hypothetical protein
VTDHRSVGALRSYVSFEIFNALSSPTTKFTLQGRILYSSGGRVKCDVMRVENRLCDLEMSAAYVYAIVDSARNVGVKKPACSPVGIGGHSPAEEFLVN